VTIRSSQRGRRIWADARTRRPGLIVGVRGYGDGVTETGVTYSLGWMEYPMAVSADLAKVLDKAYEDMTLAGSAK